ncbi:mesenchyme-specific cell surface glycoprotein-like [Agrilus planipennis]|uniref:Mesenchyme-specific cell surface glycoprotein-like n=1 Tax=Agrilus planipennis TaxID=224129 RepID=A0A7F5RC05_AGRPL|nr:mesenchyme-specific cell surface glycoprotein-like [Agrilus planipennis]
MQQQSTQKPLINNKISSNSLQDEFLRDPKDYTKFYRCVDEVKGGFTQYSFACVAGTVWDLQSSTYNYPYAGNVTACGGTGGTGGRGYQGTGGSGGQGGSRGSPGAPGQPGSGGQGGAGGEGRLVKEAFVE